MKSNSNKLFSLIFVGMLVLPRIISFTIGYDFRDNENRKEIDRPTLSMDNVEEYPSLYNAYFNDHVPYRSLMKRIWSLGNYYLFGISSDERVIIGKNDGDREHTWLFYQEKQDGDSLKEAQGMVSYTDKEKQDMYNNILSNQQAIKEYDIDLYYLFGPNKETIYFDYVPDKYKRVSEVSRLEEYISELNGKGIDNLIYPKYELLSDESEYLTYYRQDIHWNEYGAYLGYKVMMEKIHPELDKEFIEDYKVELKEDDYIETDLVILSGIRKVFRDQEVDVLFHEDFVVEENKMFNETVRETRCEDAPIDKTIFLIGDSFREDLVPYIERTYKHCFFMHRHDYYTIYVDWFWPDEVVLESVERYAPDNFNVLLKQEVETYPLDY